MVSIIIPVYQVSDYIERCIRSVMAQQYTDIECIIVDDATMDDSVDKIERLINKYDGPVKFFIIHHSVNRGLSAARNTGTKAATGDYIFYFDSDDEITPDCIEQLFGVAQKHPDADMVIGNHKRHDDGFDETGFSEDCNTVFRSNDEVFSAFERGLLPIYAWNKLIKRSFIEQHKLTFIEGVILEDMPWSFFLYKHLSKLYIYPQVTYHHFIRSNSITTSTANHFIGENYSTIYSVILQNLSNGRESRELNIYVDRFCKRYLEHREEISAYNDLMNEYKVLAERYNNRRVLYKLNVTAFLSKLPFRVNLLQKIWMKFH